MNQPARIWLRYYLLKQVFVKLALHCPNALVKNERVTKLQIEMAKKGHRKKQICMKKWKGEEQIYKRRNKTEQICNKISHKEEMQFPHITVSQ